MMKKLKFLEDHTLDVSELDGEWNLLKDAALLRNMQDEDKNIVTVVQFDNLPLPKAGEIVSIPFPVYWNETSLALTEVKRQNNRIVGKFLLPILPFHALVQTPYFNFPLTVPLSDVVLIDCVLRN